MQTKKQTQRKLRREAITLQNRSSIKLSMAEALKQAAKPKETF